MRLGDGHDQHGPAVAALTVADLAAVVYPSLARPFNDLLARAHLRRARRCESVAAQPRAHQTPPAGLGCPMKERRWVTE